MTCRRCQHGTTKKHGKHGKSSVQRYRCRDCGATFSDPTSKPLGSHTTDPQKAVQAMNLLLEGVSVRAASRMTGLHKNTIIAIMNTASRRCRETFDSKVRGIRPRYIQADELWSFVHTKQKRVKPGDPKEWGDAYIWLAFDSESKAILSYHVGQRDGQGAYELMEDLAKRIEGRFQITTDGLDAYVDPIEEHFGADADYAQLVKVYGTPGSDFPDWYQPSKVVGTIRRLISGRPKKSRVSTSHVERMNLSVRQHVKRFARLTPAHSKTLANLKAMLDVFVAWYMFCRTHSTIRVTPTMEAGITDHVWGLDELLTPATRGY